MALGYPGQHGISLVGRRIDPHADESDGGVLHVYVANWDGYAVHICTDDDENGYVVTRDQIVAVAAFVAAWPLPIVDPE